jgi:glutamine phosphoribosylpyrophosphate amidotransferase
MCGLFGIFNFHREEITEEQKQLFLKLAELNHDRGPMAAGVLTLGDIVYVDKYAGTDWLDVLKVSIDESLIYSHAVLGHCRAPTGMMKTFVQPDKIKGLEGNSYFGHNGMVLDMVALRKKTGMFDVNIPDTVHLHHLLLSNLDGLYTGKSTSLEEFLSTFKIPSSFTFWWYYKNLLTLARCQGTLYYNIDPVSFIFSSEQSDETPNAMQDGDILYVNNDLVTTSKFKAFNPL